MENATANLGAVLSAGFAINDWKLIAQSAGSLSSVWRIRTEHGDLAVRLSYIRDPERYETITAIIEMLRDNGVCVINIHQTRDGRHYWWHDGQIYIVYDWIDGCDASYVELGSEVVRSMGCTLAQVHAALNCQSVPENGLRQRKPEDRRQTVMAIRRMLEAFRPGGQSDKDRLLVQTLEYKLSELTADSYLCETGYDAYADASLVHGDFRRQNVILDDNNSIVGLVDLESFLFAPRVWDIGRACAYTFGFQFEQTRDFLQAYHEVNPLNDDEKRWLLPVAMDYLIKTMWVFDEYVTRGNTDVPIAGAADTFVYLKANQQRFDTLMCEL